MPELNRTANEGWTPIGPYAGTGKVFETLDDEIWLANVEGREICVSNVCPHKLAPLAQGEVTGRTVECPWHGYQFDLISGRCVDRPCPGLRRYEHRVVEGQLQVRPLR